MADRDLGSPPTPYQYLTPAFSSHFPVKIMPCPAFTASLSHLCNTPRIDRSHRGKVHCMNIACSHTFVRYLRPLCSGNPLLLAPSAASLSLNPSLLPHPSLFPAQRSVIAWLQCHLSTSLALRTRTCSRVVALLGSRKFRIIYLTQIALFSLPDSSLVHLLYHS